MKLSLAYSPCPNDTFIFDALVHQKVDTEGLQFELTLDDVETLNEAAFRETFDISKLSYHAYAYLTPAYVLLQAGSALGKGCGPLLIAREPLSEAAMKQARVAIPGHYTTAHFLFRLAYPENASKQNMVFSEIEQAVLDSQVDAGVIIHENRFTYAQKGLVECRDLGAFWEESTGFPIPLGGIAIRRSLPDSVKARVQRVLRASVNYAMAHPDGTYGYVRQYAQEMDRQVMYQHIALYVNRYTADLGPEGRAAVEHLLSAANRLGLVPEAQKPLFVEA